MFINIHILFSEFIINLHTIYCMVSTKV